MISFGLKFFLVLSFNALALMSPASNNHGNLQFKVGNLINSAKHNGEIIMECSINTPKGVKVADVAWASDKFIAQHGFNTPYDVAPEICVEIISPSNSTKEMDEKIKLYLKQGAKEVWLCNQEGHLSYYSQSGRLDNSLEI